MGQAPREGYGAELITTGGYRLIFDEVYGYMVFNEEGEGVGIGEKKLHDFLRDYFEETF